MPFQPLVTCSDPVSARILFDLVNEAFCKGDTDTDTRYRLADLMVALHHEMNLTTDTNGETT